MSDAPDVEFAVTITAQPLGEMAPKTREALMALIEATRLQAEQMLAGAVPALPDPAAPPLPATLAALVARAIAAFEIYEARPSGSGRLPAFLEFRDAFNTLKTRFEKEFPHGST